MAEGDDPAYGTVKTLTVEYTADGQPFSISGQDPDKINLNPDIVLTTGAGGIPWFDRGIFYEHRFERYARRGAHRCRCKLCLAQRFSGGGNSG